MIFLWKRTRFVNIRDFRVSDMNSIDFAICSQCFVQSGEIMKIVKISVKYFCTWMFYKNPLFSQPPTLIVASGRFHLTSQNVMPKGVGTAAHTDCGLMSFSFDPAKRNAKGCRHGRPH